VCTVEGPRKVGRNPSSAGNIEPGGLRRTGLADQQGEELGQGSSATPRGTAAAWMKTTGFRASVAHP